MKNNKSLLEIAIEIQSKSKENTTFVDLFNKIAEQEDLSEEEKAECIAQLYTDIVSSGDFVYCGEDLWNLKSNLKIDALDSEFYSEHAGTDEVEEEKPAKKQSRKKKKAEKMEGEENVELHDFDELVQDNEDDDSSNEDEGYENVTDDYDSDYSSDDDDDDFDYTTGDDEDGDDFDEEKYNSIMDQFEDQY